MHFGANNDIDNTNATNVWDDNYLFVGHMSDSSSQITDSTSNNDNLNQESGTPVYDVTGQIDKAITYDTTPESHNNANLTWDGIGEFTATIWFKSGAFVGTDNMTKVDRSVLVKLSSNGKSVRLYFW